LKFLLLFRLRKLMIGFVTVILGRRPVPSTCFLCISMAELSKLMRDQSGLTLRSVSNNLVLWDIRGETWL